MHVQTIRRNRKGHSLRIECHQGRKGTCFQLAAGNGAQKNKRSGEDN